MKNKKNILIISQARYSSIRLPGKVLKTILDKPMLWYLVKRIEQVKTPHKLIIATGNLKENQSIITFVKSLNINYYAGSEEDVLDRYYKTSKKFKGDIIVRITSDCPLIDPDLIDQGLKIFLNGNYDYITNVDPPTFPDGYDLEIFSFKALKIAWKEAKMQSEREHVTPYIRNNKVKFITFNFKNDVDLSNFRLTVDTQEDFILISKIIEHFKPIIFNFHMQDVINYLKNNPELLKINAQYQRNEGYLKSLKEDKKIK